MSKIERIPTYLKDYKPPQYFIKKIDIQFELFETETIVTSKLWVEKNGNHSEPLVLDGEKLQLDWVKYNDHTLDEQDYEINEKQLIVKKNEEQFLLGVQVRIKPQENTELEGLYQSGSIFCTQNEPEGFRKITYFIDRPDNMAQFTTTIIADKKNYPVLLSNGNCIKTLELEGGRHLATWEDPFLKPCYLFALVAGDLVWIQDRFMTKSGRKIDLFIYVEKGEEKRCDFAMDCLKRSMKWDEEVFGLEYDLDIYMIVAVHSFNMGAMENKGLNIFNTSCVLADPRSATDENYLRVETVICHEYFHNWTGNRVTLRDWFQLTLKEGLTVFRDQEFSSDMNVRAVKRIESVIALKNRQFPEDAGPNAHPIKPESYLEINNFYTPTIYEKGAEVIRMLHTLLGKEKFRKGIDEYFKLYDGCAITTDDFIHSMESANHIDLSQFKKWYSQVGTLEVAVQFHYEPKEKKFVLEIQQSSPKSKKSEPLYFPFAIGLIGADGNEIMPTKVLEVKEKKQTFTFEDIDSIPLPSLNRNFSAPVEVKANYHPEDYIFLMKQDTDLFNRFDASRQIMMAMILKGIKEKQPSKECKLYQGFIDAFHEILTSPNLDGMVIDKILSFPSMTEIAEQMELIDYEAIFAVKEAFHLEIAMHLKEDLIKIYQGLKDNADTIGKRKLKNLCLRYLSYIADDEITKLVYSQFVQADNMTDRFAALIELANLDCSERIQALEQFYNDWKEDQLVITKWFIVQATSKLQGTLDVVKKLCNDPVYDPKVPNIVRSVVAAFAENYIHFHALDGKGYAFMADQVLFFDEKNPLLAARLVKSFEKYKKVDKNRKNLMKHELKRILDKPNLSPNVYELVSNIMG